MKLSIFSKTKNTFEGQLPYEKTIYVLRMHWFHFAKKIIVVFISLLPALIVYMFTGYLSSIELKKMMFFLVSMYFIYIWYWIFYEATMYLLTTWILTDHRIIANIQTGLFRRNHVEIDISRIQDVSVSVEGLYETFLDYGNIEVQTAGAEKKFLLKNVPHPSYYKDKIMQAFDDYRKVHAGGKSHKNSGNL